MENHIIKTGSYAEFKSRLDKELKKATEGFVKIGYLLKVARDTNVLAESGYQTVAEFAKAEYGLSKDVVSRYIAINDRYSENGYSDRLQEKYNAYGVAKLQEMLTLPDTVLESIPPEMTRSQIQEVKKEIHQEEQISDLEVMMEEKNKEQEEMKNNLQKFMHQYFYDNKEEYAALHMSIKKKDGKENITEEILDALAPSGIATKMARLPGLGRFMLSIQGEEQDIVLISIRSNEKEIYTWADIGQMILSMCGKADAKEEWEAIYKEPFTEPAEAQEKKTEVAPVQPEKPLEKKKKSKPDEHMESAGINGSREKEGEEGEEQLPGQMQVEDYPELMPEGGKKAEAGSRLKPESNVQIKYGHLKFEMERENYKGALKFAKDLVSCLEMLIKEG